MVNFTQFFIRHFSLNNSQFFSFKIIKFHILKLFSFYEPFFLYLLFSFIY